MVLKMLSDVIGCMQRASWECLLDQLPGRELSKMSEDCDAKCKRAGVFSCFGDAAREQAGLKLRSDMIVCMN